MASALFGGGFMANDAAPQEAGGQTSGLPKRQAAGSQTLTPVTVTQIVKSIESSRADGHEDLIIDGVEVRNLTFVGKIISARQDASSINFIIDDGTGKAPVSFWNDAEDQDQAYAAKLQDEWRIGRYVRVYGSIRDPFAPDSGLSAFSIRPITDFNEVTYHFVETVKVHLENKMKHGIDNGSPGVKVEQNNNNNVGGIAGGMGNNLMGNFGGGMGNYGGMGNGMMGNFGGMGATGNGQDPCRDAVEQFFNSPMAIRSENGFSISECERALNTNFSAQQVREAIHALMEQGQLYSTIDEEHYKSTSA